jgi:AcrR family transcriptional regulator
MKVDSQVQKLTAKGARTRHRVIDGAIDAIHELGVQETTLDDMIARSATSKGQLFHYFPGGREALLLAVAEEEARRVLDDQQPHLGDLASWDSWFAWRDLVIARYRGQGRSCPLSTVITGIGRATPAAQQVVAVLIEQWRTALAGGIEAMQTHGLIDARISSTDASAALVAGVQGGVTIMLNTGSLDYLEAVLAQSLQALGAPTQADPSRRAA